VLEQVGGLRRHPTAEQKTGVGQSPEGDVEVRSAGDVTDQVIAETRCSQNLRTSQFRTLCTHVAALAHGSNWH
jgi:hypothetical protein